jgi:hypothetical protein
MRKYRVLVVLAAATALTLFAFPVNGQGHDHAAPAPHGVRHADGHPAPHGDARHVPHNGPNAGEQHKSRVQHEHLSPFCTANDWAHLLYEHDASFAHGASWDADHFRDHDCKWIY